MIAPTPTCRRELLEAGFAPERTHVIANAVDTVAFRPEATAEAPDSRLSGEERTVVYTGRLLEAKGLLELVDAWPPLLRDIPNARLVLVGSGPLEPELHRRA